MGANDRGLCWGIRCCGLLRTLRAIGIAAASSCFCRFLCYGLAAFSISTFRFAKRRAERGTAGLEEMPMDVLRERPACAAHAPAGWLLYSILAALTSGDRLAFSHQASGPTRSGTLLAMARGYRRWAPGPRGPLGQACAARLMATSDWANAFGSACLLGQGHRHFGAHPGALCIAWYGCFRCWRSRPQTTIRKTRQSPCGARCSALQNNLIHRAQACRWSWRERW